MSVITMPVPDTATDSDRQRLEAVIRRGIRPGLSSSNQLGLSLAELVEDADDDLFSQVGLWMI